MSGDWSKLENITPWKFEIIEMASILNKDRQTMVGVFVEYIVWVNEQCERAFIPASVQEVIDDKLNCPGFCDALQKVGWMNINTSDLEIINFDRHNGNTAKSRAQNNRRVANLRMREKIVQQAADGELDVTQSELHNRLPEKSIEENTSPVQSSLTSLTPPREVFNNDKTYKDE
jgi:hypothetical protein